jgi:hypothetical protein
MSEKIKADIIPGPEPAPAAPEKYRTFDKVLRAALRNFYHDSEIDEFETRPPEQWEPADYGGTFTIDPGDNDAVRGKRFQDAYVLMAAGFTVKVRINTGPASPGEPPPECLEIGPHWPGEAPISQEDYNNSLKVWLCPEGHAVHKRNGVYYCPVCRETYPASELTEKK